jgi:flavin-dependent thymidylate synthase
MKNGVQLIGYYGSDETHALSAWTSTRRQLTTERLSRLPDFLARLAQEGHHTPFEKSLFQFYVVCDVASHIHLLKHRIGVSVNAESARYKLLRDDTEDEQQATRKNGHARIYIPNDWPDELQEDLRSHTLEGYQRYRVAVEELLRRGFDKRRARESARYFLSYNTQSYADVSFNFRSLVHFIGLRLSNDAQVEIRDIATAMLQIVRELGVFEHSLRAFGYE